MSYPSSIDSFTNPSGTSTLDSPDHAGLHTSVNGAITAIETVLGTTAGTSVLKNMLVGEFPIRSNAGGTLTQVLIGGTINTSVMGTPAITGGTWNSSVLGTPTVTLGSDATGDTFYRSSGGTVTRLAIGTANQVLTSNGTVPTWATPSSSGNSPSFSVHRNGTAQTGGFGASDSFVKIQWTTEEFDTNNNFDPTTNYRFTPTVAGKYLLTVCIATTSSVVDQKNMYVAIYKNGSLYKLSTVRTSGSSGPSVSVSAVVDANGSTDYFEIYGATNDTGAYDVDGATTKSFWSGSKIG